MLAVTYIWLKISLKIDSNAVRQMARPTRVDTQCLPDRTTVAVGSNHIGCTHDTLFAGREVLNDGRHPCIVLIERDEFGSVSKSSPQMFGAASYQRFKSLLR